MDVFLLGAGRPATGKRPSALKLIANNKNAIDWQIHSFGVINNLKNIHFLGGYKIEEVIEDYPLLNFTAIPDWEEKSILHTFLRAPIFDNEILVTYSDTVFRQDTISNMLKIDADIVFCIDSCWENRYQPRAKSDIFSAETVQIEDAKGKLKEVEFTGLVHFKKTAVKLISELKEEDIGTTLIELIDYLKNLGLSVKYFDVKGDWTELNSSNDIARFILGTKAETLARLEPLVQKSHINKQIRFTSHDWSTKSNLILKKIKEKFFGANLVVRSSSKREDNWQLSNAGKFESFLNINGEDPIAIRKSVESVISSYGEKHNHEDQVLVQEFLKKTKSSGVVFTCSLETGAPYYHFNFDDQTGSTDSVTSGGKGDLRTIVVSKLKSEYLKELEPQMICVLEAVQELEQLLGYDRLDIEFGIDLDGKVHIFQVRPITLDHSDFDNNLKVIKKSLEDDVLQFDSEQSSKPYLYCDRTIFANMPDWNPAEIIGKKPKPLAFSLYRHLITNDIWAQQRYEFGYKDVRPHPLIMSFSGQPYVDTRVSFNSFLPKELPDDISNKLVNSYIDILEKNPKLHDKIEFEIAFTVWFPNFYSHAKKRLGCYGFSDNEILVLENSLKKITRAALTRLNSDTLSIQQLVRRRSDIEASNTSNMDKIFSLLDDCKRFGTLAFAHAARAGFVAKTLLKSFVETDILSSERYSEFMRSIKTVAGEFEDDKEQYQLGHLSIGKLIEKYGHLRPGTYDICAEAYWENTKKYFITDKPNSSKHSTGFNINAIEAKKLSSFLEELGSSISVAEIIEYLHHAIQLRELVKFEFTKNLSKAFDLLVKFAGELNLTRNDISFLEYDDLKQLKLNVIKTEELKEIIEKNRNKFFISQLIDLPSVISESKNFYSYEKHSSQPNFITNSKIYGTIVLLNESTTDSLEEAVVLISQADPGFDWLFGYNIGGLITQFGGANSHMAIRAAEIGLPAAIGVGEKLYEQISKMKQIELDCNNQIIREIL